MMKFYCTAGRGTEPFVTAELKEVIGPSTKITSTDGKSYFSIDNSQLNIWNKLISLKTVERIFVEVLHENFQKSDRRGLLTLLHTKLNTKTIWEDCISTLKQVVKTRSVNLQDNSSVDRTSTDNKNTHEGCSTTKRRKVEDSYTTTFRVSCRLSGFPKKQLDIQKTSKQMGVLISKLLGWKIELRHPKHEINIYLSDDTFTVGIPLTKEPLSNRSYIKHCGLRTPVAWIMAHQLDICSGDRVLDPMCGTGTILLEAAHLCQNAVYIGMDNDKSQLNLAAENITHSKIDCCVPITLLHGDALHIPLLDHSVDKLVTDAPFGQSHVVPGDLQMFYCLTLSEIFRVVKPGGTICLLTSASMKPFLQQICDRCISLQHHHGGPQPHLTRCETESVQKDSESPNSVIQTTDNTEVSSKEGNVNLCKDWDSMLMSSINLTLKGSYSVKLGETEGCIFVMLNSKKLSLKDDIALKEVL